MGKTTKLHVSPVKLLKDRLTKIKPTLSIIGLNSVEKTLIKHYPQYNTLEGGQLLSEVLKLRKADITLTEILEKIAKRELV